jgi:hypothetical protein
MPEQPTTSDPVDLRRLIVDSAREGAELSLLARAEEYLDPQEAMDAIGLPE